MVDFDKLALTYLVGKRISVLVGGHPPETLDE